MPNKNSNLKNSILNDLPNIIKKDYDNLLPSFQDELLSIINKSTKLFPNDWVLDKETTERYRALCILSQAGLNNKTKISSHRKIIGPVIVFFKKIIWKILESQLKNSFQGIQACFSNLIANQASISVENKILKDRLNGISK